INQAIIGRIIQKDPLNNTIVVQHWCHYIVNTDIYYASGAVLFPRALKKENNFVLTVSLFELKQMAKERFLKNIRPSHPISRPPVDDTLNDPIIRFVTNKLVRIKLIALKQKFKFAPSLTFYTDGSLKDPGTDIMKMGIGWVQIECFPSNRGSFSAQVER